MLALRACLTSVSTLTVCTEIVLYHLHKCERNKHVVYQHFSSISKMKSTRCSENICVVACCADEEEAGSWSQRPSVPFREEALQRKQIPQVTCIQLTVSISKTVFFLELRKFVIRYLFVFFARYLRTGANYNVSILPAPPVWFRPRPPHLVTCGWPMGIQLNGGSLHQALPRLACRTGCRPFRLAL